MQGFFIHKKWTRAFRHNYHMNAWRAFWILFPKKPDS